MLVAVLGRCLPNGNSSFGKFEFEQARALQRHGKYDVVYCVSDNRSIRQNLYPRKTDGIINEVRYFERILPVGGLPYSIFNLVRFSSQCGLLNDIEMCVGKPDVLYAHFPGITLSQRFIREIKSRNINLVCLEHWTKVKNRTCGRARERTIRCAVKSSSSFLCVSNDLASSVMEICGEEDGISVIPNIIPDEFYKSYDSLKINPSDSLKETKFISVGRLEKNKRIDLIIEAFSLLSKRIRARLIIAGSGSEEEKLRAQVVSLGLSDAVSFIGWVSGDDLRKLYLEATAYVTASSDETFCVPIVESWILGTPCIASSINPLRSEFAESNGVLFEDGDVNSLTNAMEIVANNKDIFICHRNNLSEWAEGLFSERAVVSRLESILARSA